MSCLFNMRDRNPGRRSGLDNKHLICARLGGGGAGRECERERESEKTRDKEGEGDRKEEWMTEERSGRRKRGEEGRK